MGHDRFVADLRPLLRPILKQRAFACRLCCHPHDVCTELIAREAGALITSEKGDRLQAPLNVEAEVCWTGYASADLQFLVEPLLHSPRATSWAACRIGLLCPQYMVHD